MKLDKGKFERDSATQSKNIMSSLYFAESG